MAGTKALTIEVMAEYVKKYTKGVGLRLIYHKFGVPEETKPQVKRLWDKIAEELGIEVKLPKAFEKKKKKNEEKRKKAKNGD